MPFTMPIAPPKPPSSLTAALLSPRLLVNTFKHTLRGGIILSLTLYFWLAVEKQKKKQQGKDGISRKNVHAQSFVKSGVRWSARSAR
jgi:hypothetical protein